MNVDLKVLVVEDSEDDTLLLLRELRKAGYRPQHERVDTAADMGEAMDRQAWDIIIADYAMPRFDALAALQLAQARDPDLPFIIVSGRIGESVAVDAMRAGAHDYIMKSNMSRLCPAIERELKDAAVRRERKMAEEALRKAQKMESLGLMASGVAHDFNNLLVAIMGQCSLAMKNLPAGSKANEHLTKTVYAAEKAADLTRQMLAYAGGGDFEFKAVDLNLLLQDSLPLIDAMLPSHVTVEPKLAHGLPQIEADPSQIQQILMNLALNGAEAIGNRAGQITISTGVTESPTGHEWDWIHALAVDGEGPRVFLDMEDDGCGMARNTAARIFDPFFTTKDEGRGLGLAAVLGIVRSHQAGMMLKSAQGKGTLFRILFPVGVAARKEAVPKREKRQDTLAKVMVVDDESLVREAVSDILAQQGIEVIAASGGEEALRQFHRQKESVDLVLLDLTMPGMSGEETLQALFEQDPEARILIASGCGLADARKRLEGERPVGFLRKPFDAHQLVQAIGTALHRTNV
jgi:signal transduction histidine kinase